MTDRESGRTDRPDRPPGLEDPRSQLVRRVRLDTALLDALDRALDLDADARTAWLAELRRDQPEVAAEVEALLRREDELVARGFLEGDAAAGLLAAAPALAGQRVGAYTLVRPVGQGGMGSVWLARRSDGRYEAQVAVKLLSPALIDRVGEQRFRREGNTLARLTHPNIARLIDAGVTAAGQPFLVLEHVEGTRIDRYSDERRLVPAQRLDLFRQVLAAVAHAHTNLIVHRDLKPSNILVTHDGVVKLLDFGIAKLLDRESAAADRTELTEAGGLPFTPEYAAPEQVTGGPITTATDVYSLGVLLYLLLAGRHPTGAGCVSRAQHLRALVEAEPARLSAAMATTVRHRPADLAAVAAARGSTAERLRRLYGGDLDNILRKALQKDPAHRYASVGAFADDIARYLRHEPVRARPASLGYRARKFARRNRGTVAMGGLTVGALLAATAVTTTQMIEARQQRDEARAQRDRAIYQERRATASSGFMDFLLQNIAASGEAYTPHGLLGRARELLESDYRGDPQFVARMMVELSVHYYRLRDRQGQYALLTRADELATRADDPEIIAHANCWLAMTRAFDGQVARARRHLARADRYLARVPEPPLDLRIRCLHARSNLARRLGQVDSALGFARTAVALSEAAGDTGSYRHQRVLNELAGALNTAGRFREALEVTRRSIVLLARMGRDSTGTMTVERYNEAVHLALLGEKVEADARLTGVAALAASMDSQAQVPTYMATLAGDLANDLGRPDSAVASLERAVTGARNQRDAAGQVRALTSLTRVLVEHRRFAEARQHASELRRLLAPGERPVLALLAAEEAGASGDWARAYRLSMEYLAARGFPNRPPGTYYYPRAVIDAARAAFRSGNPVAADSLAGHALRLARGEGHADTRSGDIGAALLVLARARLAQHDSAAALDALRRAQQPLATGYGPEHPRTAEARALLDSLGT